MMVLMLRTPPVTGTIGRVKSALCRLPPLPGAGRGWGGRVWEERRRRFQIGGANEVRPVLMDVVGTGEEPVRDLALESDRAHLGSRIEQFVRIIRDLGEIQTVLGKLRHVVVTLAGDDRDIA